MTIMQPLIAPLYGGKSAHELLAAFTETPEKSQLSDAFAITGRRSTQAPITKPGGSIRCTTASSKIRRSPPVNATAKLVAAQPASSAASAGYEISFHSDPYILDGRYANNAWLQELPRPVTRLTWDNAVIVSEKTAKDLEVNDEDRVAIDVNGQTVWGSIWRVPGQPDGSIGSESRLRPHAFGPRRQRRGFRRESAAHRCESLFRHWRKGEEAGREVPPGRRAAPLRDGRPRAGQAGTLDEYKQDPYFAQKESETAAQGPDDLPANWQYKGYAWGMAIDLTSCIGCNACVVACQAENNIPVVGKEQVLNTREMHWIRIDRYYKRQRRTSRRRTSSRWPACSAKTRPANWSARWRRPSTMPKA